MRPSSHLMYNGIAGLQGPGETIYRYGDADLITLTTRSSQQFMSQRMLLAMLAAAEDRGMMESGPEIVGRLSKLVVTDLKMCLGR